MTTAQIVVTIGGVVLTLLIVWYFWLSRKPGTRVAVNAAGVQEVDITVQGGYTPDLIVVKAGKPVRLNFHRQETSACSEMVVFGSLNRSATLPTGMIVPVELAPPKPGEYEFTCQMGMLRGKLVAE